MVKGYEYSFVQWILLVLLFLLNACTSVTEKPTRISEPTSAYIERGKQLFVTRCASCHKVNQELTGPALKGAEARWPDKQKLYAFIRNSEEVIRNDKYARELWLQYNQTVMLAQPGLTDADIRAVLDYINNVSER